MRHDQELYSYLKHIKSATNTLFITPIEVMAGVGSARIVFSKVIEKPN